MKEAIMILAIGLRCADKPQDKQAIFLCPSRTKGVIVS